MSALKYIKNVYLLQLSIDIQCLQGYVFVCPTITILHSYVEDMT